MADILLCDFPTSREVSFEADYVYNAISVSCVPFYKSLDQNASLFCAANQIVSTPTVTVVNNSFHFPLQVAPVSSLQTVLSTKGHHFPSLTNVIAYLNVTANQEYLVARLKGKC